MIIKISNDWRINRSDHHNWILQERMVTEKGKHAGEERWDNRAYYLSPDQAIVGMFRRRVGIIDAEIPEHEAGAALRMLGAHLDEIKADAKAGVAAMVAQAKE